LGIHDISFSLVSSLEKDFSFSKEKPSGTFGTRGLEHKKRITLYFVQWLAFLESNQKDLLVENVFTTFLFIGLFQLIPNKEIECQYSNTSWNASIPLSTFTTKKEMTNLLTEDEYVSFITFFESWYKDIQTFGKTDDTNKGGSS